MFVQKKQGISRGRIAKTYVLYLVGVPSQMWKECCRSFSPARKNAYGISPAAQRQDETCTLDDDLGVLAEKEGTLL